MFYGLKDVKYLFDKENEIYEEIKYSFNESIILFETKQNGLEYEKIEKLISVQSRKENCKYASFIHEII